jgi:dihydroneopterin aldolase
MGIISLEGVEFYAFHGVFEEEQRIGNRFTIDIEVETDVSSAGKSDDLTDTVDYQRLYELIREVMDKPSALLEHVASSILESVRATYPHVHRVKVKVSKLNPPIGAICKRASLTLEA